MPRDRFGGRNSGRNRDFFDWLNTAAVIDTQAKIAKLENSQRRQEQLLKEQLVEQKLQRLTIAAEEEKRTELLRQKEEERNVIQAEQFYLNAKQKYQAGILDIYDLYEYAMCFWSGEENYPQVPLTARKFFEEVKRAAEQGHVEAQYLLGGCYEYEELGLSPDLPKAVFWYTKAAEQGHAEAQCQLGRCYEEGKGVQQDLLKAIEYYTKAAEQGHAEAQYRLGGCYEEGKGVQQDLLKAIEYYTKAAEQGLVEAKDPLAKVKRRLQIEEGCQKAFDQNDVQALFQHAQYYETGDGVPKDLVKAIKCYTKAAEQGLAEAKGLLRRIYQMPGSSLITDEEFLAFIGLNGEYYLKQFKAFQKGEKDGFAPTWNWGIALCIYGGLLGLLWPFYRKIPLGEITTLFSDKKLWGILGAVIALICLPVTGNYIYYQYAKKKILVLKVKDLPREELLFALSKEGGTMIGLTK